MTQLPIPDDRQSQCAAILERLLRGERLTPLGIYNLCGSMRASGRIYDLRHGVFDGTEYPIEAERVAVKARGGRKAVVCEYYLKA